MELSNLLRSKSTWITLSLFNLTIVALFGFLLRSKILFPIHAIDYRSLLSAHSHFAFAGWVGLVIITLLIFNLLSYNKPIRPVYIWILIMVEISSLGMAVLFPFLGYRAITIFFSSLYIVANFIFAPFFYKDVMNADLHPSVKLLSLTSISSLLLSAVGPLGLSLILLGKTHSSIVYRDSIYWFLHFQYNGFFTTGVLALFFHYLVRNGKGITNNMRKGALLLSLSIVPAVFLALLWHNNVIFYIIAAIACVLILWALYCFAKFFFNKDADYAMVHPLAASLRNLAIISFFLKMFLNVGTIIPQLGNAVYGDRPVIIGFLHLVFLAFISFYIFSVLIEEGYFNKAASVVKLPFIIFGTGVVLTETFLMLQGLQILFKTNSNIYSWLLWAASILLFLGAVLIFSSRMRLATKKP